jgi:aquaporin Z
MDARDVVGYIVGQIIGGILAAALLLAIAKGVAGGYDPALTGFAANGYGDHSPDHYNLISAFLAEVILTFFLMFTDIKAPVGFAGIPIGLVLALIHLVPVTNTSVNPARSIGPAVFVGGWALSQLWLFIIAPTALDSEVKERRR